MPGSEEPKIKITQKPTEAEQFQSLLEENLEYSKANYAMLSKINRNLAWQRVFNIIKIIIIIVPLIFGIIYLPPLIQQALSGYQSLLQQ